MMSAETEIPNENILPDKEPPDLYELLEAIRLRPAMYLGRKSLRDLDVWISGYRMGKAHSGALCSMEEQALMEFDDFIQEKYCWQDVGGWASKIAYYHRDDSTALDEFFKLFDEFRESKRQKLDQDDESSL